MLRQMWIREAHRYEHVAVRFVAGINANATTQAAMEAEAKKHGDMMFLAVPVRVRVRACGHAR